QRDDDGKKTNAGVDGAEADAAVTSGLRKQVAERSAQRAREDVDEPEGENRIGAEIIGEGDDRDQRAECDDAELEAEAFGRQIPGCRSQRKREEDRRPVEQLAPPGDN